MIIETAADWQNALQDIITEPGELLELLHLDRSLLAAAKRVAKCFPLRVPREFIARMQPGDPRDPLLLQVLPLHAELSPSPPGYSKDPLQEQNANPVPGLLHKYQGRVLLTVAGGCAIHCRYCFRRHFPYEDNNSGRAGWQNIHDYIADDPLIKEVIFSGGDPLVANDDYLYDLASNLASIPHLTTLRIHTRLPIVIPSRITTSFCDWMNKLGLKTVVVVHCNHPNEIDDSVQSALMMMKNAGITLLNQAVLLRGINDEAKCLIQLSEVLFAAGVLPYYLHLLDPVEGAAHFEVPELEARRIHQQVQAALPGYLVPRLVREEAEASEKILLS